MRLTIATKAILTFTLLIAFSLTLVGIYLERREHSTLISLTAARLEAQATILAAEVVDGLRERDAWARRAATRTKARITLIDAGGRVLADSEESSASMENHADRPEVIQALAGGSGQAIRFSRSVHRDLLYFAETVPTAGSGPVILRLSVPLGEATRGFGEFRRDFWAIAALSLAVACGIAILWARHMAQQLHRMLAFARGVSRGEMAARLPAGSRDELGDLTAALNEMADDLKTTLRRLETEGQRLRTITESMGEGLLVLDAHNRISLLNPAAETLLGLDRETALGQTSLEALRSYELDDLLKVAEQKDGTARAEITLTHPRRRILAGTAVAMRDAGGILQGTVVALRDITQLKRLEEMRMEFVLNVSHELRTPLTAIRGYAETLRDGGVEDRETMQKFLEVIHRHAERLGRLLDDLLELSNLELERTPLQVRPASFLDIARQVVALLAPQAEKKAIRLTTAVPDDLPPVRADRDRLIQILVNLVDNALKYTPEGGSVTLAARRVDSGEPGSREVGEPSPQPPSPHAPMPFLEFTVTDTGNGIPQKDLPRITERFYRVDKARSRDLGGTGLGLAIVKHLVAAQGGTLAIESALGKGTTVRILLPAAPPPPSPIF